MKGPFSAEPLEIHVVRDDDDAVLGPPHVHLEHLRPAILDGVPEGTKDEIILNTSYCQLGKYEAQAHG